MSGSPDSEFSKIFELLHAFEQLDDDEQQAFLQSADADKQPLKPKMFVPNLPPAKREAGMENSFAAHIASAMAKRKF
jgi:hypothetical protein